MLLHVGLYNVFSFSACPHADKPMHLNEGRFMQNGRCGYVLMPDCMFDPGFNPLDPSTHISCTPITIHLEIIAGRHLVRTGRGICSPLVEVEVLGIDADWAKFKCSTCSKWVGCCGVL